MIPPLGSSAGLSGVAQVFDNSNHPVGSFHSIAEVAGAALLSVGFLPIFRRGGFLLSFILEGERLKFEFHLL